MLTINWGCTIEPTIAQVIIIMSSTTLSLHQLHWQYGRHEQESSVGFWFRVAYLLLAGVQHRPDQPAGVLPPYPDVADSYVYGPNYYSVCPPNSGNKCSNGFVDTGATLCVDASDASGSALASVLFYCPPLTYGASSAGKWGVGASNSYFHGVTDCDPISLTQSQVSWADAPSAWGQSVNLTATHGHHRQHCLESLLCCRCGAFLVR